MELRKVHIYFELFSLEWQEHLMDAVKKLHTLPSARDASRFRGFPFSC